MGGLDQSSVTVNDIVLFLFSNNAFHCHVYHPSLFVKSSLPKKKNVIEDLKPKKTYYLTRDHFRRFFPTFLLHS